MYTEDDFASLSALQHLLFCERQCALIHVEQVWVENRYTAEGRVMHERVHTASGESRGGVRTEFSVSLRSFRLGVSGVADAVEYHREDGPGNSVVWRPFPVEHKRGRPKKALWDKIQLCAQGMCLEEMTGVDVPEGALFYGKTRRRQDVRFDEELRRETADTAKRLHELIENGKTPAPVHTKACDRCSFVGLCLPKALDGRKTAGRYLREVIKSQ